MAELLVDRWERAALRSRLRRDPAPLTSMLDFYLGVVGQPTASPQIRSTKRWN